MRKLLAAVGCLTAALTCLDTPIESRPAGPVGSTEIRWDEYGVPHISASTVAGASYAFGWAQMESHGDLLLEDYARARGRAAEYFGPSWRESDRWVLTNDIPSRAEQWLEQQTPEFRGLLESFAAGINAYGHDHADTLSATHRAVLPVRAADILAHVQHAVHFTFIANRDRIVRSAETAPPAGSNGWAIAPKYATSHHAMLLINPHLPWAGVYRLTEAHVRVDKVIDVYGATFVGFPVIGMGFNEKLGWTHTVNTFDGADLFRLTLEGDGYRWGESVRPLERVTHTLRVRAADGSVTSETFDTDHSIHGPIIAKQGGTAIALRVSGLDRPRLLEEWWDMARAGDTDAFERVIRRLDLPIFTILSADRGGHILSVFGGLTPKRASESYPWAGIVPGQTPATLWTAYHSYGELPRVRDPQSGWLQNANEPPFWTTMPSPLRQSAYPSYLAPGTPSLRSQESIRLLQQGPLSLDTLVERKHSTHALLADRVLSDLESAARDSDGESRRHAFAVLKAWDRRFDSSSAGAVLFGFWVAELMKRFEGRVPYQTPWEAGAPLTSPAGLRHEPGVIEALDAAVTRMEGMKLPLDARWGDVYRVRVAGEDTPASGGPGELGVFRTLNFGAERQGRFEAVAGDSFVAAVEFARPVRARALLVYGNWTQGRDHRADQLGLFARGALRPVWFSQAEVLAHTKRLERIAVPQGATAATR